MSWAVRVRATLEQPVNHAFIKTIFMLVRANVGYENWCRVQRVCQQLINGPLVKSWRFLLRRTRGWENLSRHEPRQNKGGAAQVRHKIRKKHSGEGTKYPSPLPNSNCATDWEETAVEWISKINVQPRLEYVSVISELPWDDIFTWTVHCSKFFSQDQTYYSLKHWCLFS